MGWLLRRGGVAGRIACDPADLSASVRSAKNLLLYILEDGKARPWGSVANRAMRHKGWLGRGAAGHQALRRARAEMDDSGLLEAFQPDDDGRLHVRLTDEAQYGLAIRRHPRAGIHHYSREHERDIADHKRPNMDRRMHQARSIRR